MGMEKEKPHKCEYCNKRYKNLNGLKYVSLTIFSGLVFSVPRPILATPAAG